MATFEATTRTNYFHVKDVEKFKKLINDLPYGRVFETLGKNGEDVFGFGWYECMPDEEEFYNELQKLVADDDAIIIFMVGNEKLRYLTGIARIITSTKQDYVDLTTMATTCAAELLENPNWSTRCDY